MKTAQFIFSSFICALSLFGMETSHHRPYPPKLPTNFKWSGRYIVPNLVDPATGNSRINVSFTWHGNNGDVQMIAGSMDDPIYFTNFIYNNKLYTYTFKWPGLQPELLPPLEPCNPIRDLSIDELNAFLATSYIVGPEILLGATDRNVNHFRLSIVEPRLPPGLYPRLPISLGDIYVDEDNSCKIWQLLHFGLQNIYAPGLDEWIKITSMQDCPGEIIIPDACTGETDNYISSNKFFPLSFFNIP
jgi:hypothetical protein